MPKDTFFNLSNSKRDRIVEAALSEFQMHTFDHASINRIVEKSNISKGSFYQYFEDKKDLYKYLIEKIATDKMAYLTPAMQNPFDHTLFEVIHDMNFAGLRFALDQPQYMEIGRKLMQDKSHPIFHEIMASNQEKAIVVYKSLVEQAQVKGEIKAELDPNLIANLIMRMSIDVIDLVTNSYEEIKENEIMRSLDQLMLILTHGLKEKEGKHD